MKKMVVMRNEMNGVMVPKNLPNTVVRRIAKKIYEQNTRPHKWDNIGDERVQRDWIDFVTDVHTEVFREYKRNGK